VIILDTLTLPALTWRDPWSTGTVSAPVRRRLDGGLVVYPRPLAGGRVITLDAPSDQPLSVAQADALAALAAVPGATYDLSMPLRGFAARVFFDWSQGAPLELTALIDYADPAPDDPVTGTIHLITA